MHFDNERTKHISTFSKIKKEKKKISQPFWEFLKYDI